MHVGAAMLLFGPASRAVRSRTASAGHSWQSTIAADAVGCINHERASLTLKHFPIDRSAASSLHEVPDDVIATGTD